VEFGHDSCLRLVDADLCPWGVVAFCGGWKYGSDGILIRGILGVSLNVVFFFLTLLLTVACLPCSVGGNDLTP